LWPKLLLALMSMSAFHLPSTSIAAYVCSLPDAPVTRLHVAAGSLGAVPRHQTTAPLSATSAWLASTVVTPVTRTPATSQKRRPVVPKSE